MTSHSFCCQGRDTVCCWLGKRVGVGMSEWITRCSDPFCFYRSCSSRKVQQVKHKKSCNEAKLISDTPVQGHPYWQAGLRSWAGLGRAPLGTGTVGTRLWLLLCAGLAFQQGRAHSENCLLWAEAIFSCTNLCRDDKAFHCKVSGCALLLGNFTPWAHPFPPSWPLLSTDLISSASVPNTSKRFVPARYVGVSA